MFMEDFQLGQNIQKLRIEQGMSLRKFSALAGITPSMLSQIENTQVNPSINTLRAIAMALNVPMFRLFQSAPTEGVVVHPENRRLIGTKREPNVHYELLTPDFSGTIEFCLMTVEPLQSSFRDAMSHAGEEVAYMLSGKEVVLELEGVRHSMTPGDSVRIGPNLPHVWHNNSDMEAQIIFAITPPTF